MAESQKAAEGSVAADADQFAALLQKQFKPKTDGARAEVERAVRTLAEQALRETTVVSDDVVGTIKAIIAEIDQKLKIRVLNISKKDLAKTLKKYKGASWDQSPLFKKMYEQEYGQLGG